MLTWILLAVVGCALLVLVLAVRAVLVRLPALRRAVLALQRRQVQVEALATQAQRLQSRVEALERSLAEGERRRSLARPGRPG